MAIELLEHWSWSSSVCWKTKRQGRPCLRYDPPKEDRETGCRVFYDWETDSVEAESYNLTDWVSIPLASLEVLRCATLWWHES